MWLVILQEVAIYVLFGSACFILGWGIRGQLLKLQNQELIQELNELTRKMREERQKTEAALASLEPYHGSGCQCHGCDQKRLAIAQAQGWTLG